MLVVAIGSAIILFLSMKCRCLRSDGEHAANVLNANFNDVPKASTAFGIWVYVNHVLYMFFGLLISNSNQWPTLKNCLKERTPQTFTVPALITVFHWGIFDPVPQ
jgi:hypothetical protein